MKIIVVKSYSELKEIYSSLNQDHIYRGQGDSSWEINSTLYRYEFINDKTNGEREILKTFEKGIHLYEQNVKIPTDKLEKLAYLQHHGAPTRLIDFTYSPYVATYFALKECKDVCSVFTVDYKTLPSANLNYVKKRKEKYLIELLELQNINLSEVDFNNILKYGTNGYYDKYMNVTKSNLYSDEIHESRDRLNYTESLITLLKHDILTINDTDYSTIFSYQNVINIIFKVEPFFLNSRRLAQNGCFLCQNNNDISFMKTLSELSEYESKIASQINIPRSLRNEILTDLMKMNISESSMFPGLDGFIRSLGLKLINQNA